MISINFRINRWKVRSLKMSLVQWRNRRGGGAECPQKLLTGTFLLTYRVKKSQGKNVKGGKWRSKERKIVEGKVKIENGRREKFQNEERTFFFFFFLSFSLFKRTEICFGSTKIEIFYGNEEAFHALKKKKKSGK